MIKITLSDGNIKNFDKAIKISDIALNISKSLYKKAFAAEVNNILCDLNDILSQDAHVKIITTDDLKSLDISRYNTAVLMAFAVKELFPNVQFIGGETNQDGFYYDFVTPKPFSQDDFKLIEEKMLAIQAGASDFCKEIWNKEKIITSLNNVGQLFLIENLQKQMQNEYNVFVSKNSFYVQDNEYFINFSTVKFFKIIKVSGIQDNILGSNHQRIYGTSWIKQKDLEIYLHNLEEAKKRDHRRIAKDLNLLHFQSDARGIAFWHPNGFVIYENIKKYIRRKLTMADYVEVKTPALVSSNLWKESGHWDKFRDDMFQLHDEDDILCLKPMNCPCHVQIFNQVIRSYKDLPFRMAEFGSCYRNEASGALHGLFRGRNFTQDDAHIFCTEEQISQETIQFCNLLLDVYKDFGFNKVKIKLSDRPEKRLGEDDIWDKSENALKDALLEMNIEYEINKGEGAFYGPKIEFVLVDALGRDWQCGTLQIDFILPKRLMAKYINSEGKQSTPIMIHRAIIGSLERFIGILIEEYSGAFPIWLAPIQVIILTVVSAGDEYANYVYRKLLSEGVKSELDISNEKVNYKIFQAAKRKIPITIVIGKQEVEQSNLTVRYLGSDKTETISLDKLLYIIKAEEKKYFV